MPRGGRLDSGRCEGVVRPLDRLDALLIAVAVAIALLALWLLDLLRAEQTGLPVLAGSPEV